METGSDSSREIESLRRRVAQLEAAAAEHASAEEEILRTIADLKRTFDDAPIGLCFLDTGLRYVHINQWMAKINGVAVDAHLGRTLREVVPAVADGAELQLRHVLELGEPILAGTVDAETPAHPGITRTYEHYYYPDTDADGVIVGVSCVVLDVTERKKAELGLRRWAHIFENAEVPIVVSAPNGVIELVNPAAARMYGAPPEQFVGKSVMHLYAPEFRDRVAGYSRAVNEQGHLSFETKHVRRDGTIFDVQASITAVSDEDGEVQYRVANLQDISQRKKLEEQFLQAQKLESLGILAGGIAHDFNNILSVILGNAELALMEFAESSPTQDCLEQIRTASQRASELVNQMLTYSGKGSITVSSLDLNDLVSDTTELLRSIISKQATLRCELSGDPLRIEGDAVQLRQVIMNLITNASDAIGDSEGTILLRTGCCGLAQAELDALPASAEPTPEHFVYLEVSDSGVGMDAPTIARIFDPFFSTKFSGRGLGLAAVQGIVRSHRGVMKVGSAQGDGSTFTVYLPSSEAPVREQAELVSSTVVRLGAPRTILVVDDEPEVLRTTQRMLEALGHRVLTATDGILGLALYERLAPSIDVVLLDLTMPRMGGEEAFEEIRRIRPDAQAILMSGYDHRGANERLLSRGFASFLKKPFDITELSGQLKMVCSTVDSSSKPVVASQQRPHR